MVQVSFLRTIPESLWPKLRKPFKAYALLGDDLVIADSNVAHKYYEVLKELDIEYSPSKTHISENFYEFAKRVFYDGHEITGFAVGGLRSVYKSYPLLHNFLQNQKSHGFTFDTGTFGSFIHSVYRIFKQDRYSFEHTSRILKLYTVFNQLSEDKVTGDFSLTFKVIEELFGYSLPSELSNNLIFVKLIEIAKKKLFERDLIHIKQSHNLVFTKLNNMVASYVKT
jgi:hypothetical protein